MPYEDEIPPYATLAQPSEEINQLAHRVLGICIEIHRELGPGLPEEAYEEALAMEFEAHGIRFQRQLRIPIMYKGRCVTRVRLDFLIESILVLEANRLIRSRRSTEDKFSDISKSPNSHLVFS